MKSYLAYILIFVLASCSVESQKVNYDADVILSKSKAHHNPKDVWKESIFMLRIQEPRISNPTRYSILKLNNKDGSFELTRNRGKHLSKHVIDKNNVSKVFLDGSEDVKEALLKEYRLNPSRNVGYRNFYTMLYGLPMTLNEATLNELGKVESSVYNNQDCYKIPIVLKEEMFSKHWIIYIQKTTFEFKGMEIIFPEDKTKGERLFFEGEISIGEFKIPRIRHWHELIGNEYSGSDIIMGESIEE